MRRFIPKSTALYGITAEDIAEWCGVHITTARRWKRGEEPTRSAKILIDLMTTGDMSLIDPAWHGWRIGNGKIIAPDTTSYTPGEVMASNYWRRLARNYQVDQRLPQQADWVKQEWTVNEITEEQQVG